MFNSKQHASWNLSPGGGGGGGGQHNRTFSSSGRPTSLTSEDFCVTKKQEEDLEGQVRRTRMPAGSQASFLTTTTSSEDDQHDDESLQQLQKPLTQGGPSSSSMSSKKPMMRRCVSESDSGNSSSRNARVGGGGGGGIGSSACAGIARSFCPGRGKPGSTLDKLCVLVWRLTCVAAIFLAINALVYFWPIAARHDVQPKVAPLKPRPRFAGPLEVNSKLDELAEKLYENQFHAPESMAWTSNKRAFFTGVEGGFILLVEPYAERWTIAARLNARLSVEDKSRQVSGTPTTGDNVENGKPGNEGMEVKQTNRQLVDLFVPFCTRDIELYGPRAEFEPSLVRISRCSRPLGIRLAPNETHLYVADPLSGLYRIDLVPNLAEAIASQTRPLAQMNHVSKLLDFTGGSGGDVSSSEKMQAGGPPSGDKVEEEIKNQQADHDIIMLNGRPQRQEQVHFGDDIAVEWGVASAEAGSPDTPPPPQSDVIYMTDCSRRWSLRYLFWMMLENDDSGRVLRYDTKSSQLSQLDAVLPVRSRTRPNGPLVWDERGLSFPNGLEFTANKSALLISDLNNRRILMHHLRGPLAGTTNLVMWTPGYSDNVRRGLDQPDGTPTYWFACGCAVNDGKYEIAELANDLPFLKRLFLRWLHVFGTLTTLMGRLLNSTTLKDAGLMIDSVWLKVDPYCTHGLVAQFNERGQILRSLHGPRYSSNFKLLSEAHQVPLLSFPSGADKTANLTANQEGHTNSERSLLYLGSVYYSYLGRLELAPHKDPAVAAGSSELFRIDNTDHIFDVNKKQHDHDQVDLVCPQAAQQQVASNAPGENNKTLRPGVGGGDLLQQQQERYIIYSVSKDEYDTCRLNGPSARVVAVCDQPQRARPPITITFRSFTPQPNGLEFKPGQDYYFITALHGHQADPVRRFSPCRDQNMKVTFKICCKSSSAGAGNPLSATPTSPVRQPMKSQQVGSQQPSVSPPSQPRPPVMTIRPTFKMPSAVASPDSQTLGSYFNSLANSQSNGQQQQQQQPVTVLPIEDIQPPSESSAQTAPGPNSSPDSQDSSSPSSIQDNNKNDIQNEQPTIFHQPAAAADPFRDLINSATAGSSGSGRSAHQANSQRQPLLPFDPSAPPAYLQDKWAGRWQPTPLPERLRPSELPQPASIPTVQLRPAPWELPPPSPVAPAQQQGGRVPHFTHNRQPQPLFQTTAISNSEQQQQQPDRRNQAANRGDLYPWQHSFTSSEPQIDAYARNTLVTAPSQDQQTGGGSATGAPTFAVALLVPLLALAILLALGLERRLR